MALIKFENLIEQQAGTDQVFVANVATDFVVCKSPDKLKILLDALQPDKAVFYVSDGDWSMHDLVMQLLKSYSPAELFITTYALREFAVRQLVLALDKKDITGIHMLLDHRATVRTAEVYHLANSNFTQIYLTAIHAKVTVIKSQKGTVTIVGSANYTSNPKIESGVIIISEEVGNFNINWIKKVMENAEIFE